MLSSSVSTGRVVGRFAVGVVDGDDADEEPDLIPAKGTITFTASIPYMPNGTADPDPVTILKTSIVTVLDDDGYLCTPNPANPGVAGRRGVRLFATDDEDAGVVGWTWNATPRFVDKHGSVLANTVPAFSFALPSGSERDLTRVVKVPSSPGVGKEQAEALVDVAATAAAAAEQHAAAAAADAEVARIVKEQADAGLFRGVKGDPGDRGAKGDKGDKGDPGIGWNPTTVFSTQDANALTTPGVYVQSSGSSVALNWPIAARGVLQVSGNDATNNLIRQQFTLTGALGPRRFWVRDKLTATEWTSWQVYASQRVDNTAGRALYTWDDTQNRDQLIYGDTGWRNLNALIPQRTSGNIYYRREMFTVTFLFENLLLDMDPGILALGTIPGTQPVLTGSTIIASNLHGSHHDFNYRWDQDHSITKRGDRGTSIKGLASFPTRSPWPSTLLGSPVTGVSS